MWKASINMYRRFENRRLLENNRKGSIIGGVQMNKTELVAAMAEQAGLSKKDAEKALKAFTDVVADELKKDGKVQLVGFGTFEVSKRAARVGRNPQSGKVMEIAASKAPKFKAGKALKDIVNA
jgi:DNA-binding protein HU-beta